jgi:hypothetical protein
VEGVVIPLLERQYEYKQVIRQEVISDWGLIQPIINTAGWQVDGTDGAHIDDETDSTALILAGGPWRKIGMVAAMKFKAPTVAGGEDISIMLNVYSNFVASVRHHVLVSLRAGQLVIDKVVADARNQLAATPFALAQNTWANLEATREGTTVKARVNGGEWLTASVPENEVPLQGVFGFRSGRVGSSNICLKSFTVGMGAA